MVADLTNLKGSRGEKILDLWLTDFKEFPEALFRPQFLGEKWPTIDFYVELETVHKGKPYFFAQVKSTTTALSGGVRISVEKKDIELLLQIPGPTYIFGVHEPSKAVFVRSVHTGTPVKGISRIPLSHKLTRGKFRVLHREVQEFWKTHGRKPLTSSFS
jgi:Domain of unknown function (DUF4365)